MFLGDRIIVSVPLSSSPSPLIIMSGGGHYPYLYNDAWSFDISTRKLSYNAWGSFRLRAGHAAVLVGDVMYVFSGHAVDETNLVI